VAVPDVGDLRTVLGQAGEVDGRIGPRMVRTRRRVLDAANALLEESVSGW
jgi:hypothetical protein